MRKKINSKSLRLIVAGFIVTAFSFLAFFDFSTVFYQANILNYPEHEPFDGTVYPIKKVPNWTKFDFSRKDVRYSDLTEDELVAIPYYDPSVLAFPAGDLIWGNTRHNEIRNAKITYSVPYMGNYRLDGLEYEGSHGAVDIKVPEGTPVYSIANGTVVKVSTVKTGFGHHVVVTHKNVPSLENPNAKVTLHSSYSHLSDIFVSVGDVVRKGDRIALTGATGTVTTPHLHFQIDNDKAPWSPFWPFTWQEVSDAGLNFFSAVNEGLGKEKAISVTVNPVKYVQKYMDSSFDASSYAEDVEDKHDPTKGPESVSYVDNVVQGGVRKGPEAISYVDKDNVVAGDTLQKNVVAVDKINQEGNLRFSDVDITSSYYDAVIFLSDRNIIEGYGDKTFRTDRLVNRVEALKFILESIDAPLEKGTVPFSDVSGENWFDDYLYTGYKLGIVEGYPDGTFKPNNPVNKAELLKILFNGMKVDIDPNVSNLPYEDVSAGAWFTHYFAYAKDLGVLDTGVSTIRPSESMTRGEVANAMYKLVRLVE